MRPPAESRRHHHRMRCRASVSARIMLDNDVMRQGTAAEILDISNVGVALLVPQPFETGTVFTLLLENRLQRFQARVRAVVRNAVWVGEGDSPGTSPGNALAHAQREVASAGSAPGVTHEKLAGEVSVLRGRSPSGARASAPRRPARQWRLGCTLQTPLTPLQVLSLRRPAEFEAPGAKTRWF